MAKNNKGSQGIDGITFEMIELAGVEQFFKKHTNRIAN
ncbi:Uncharacterised protein [Orientia tsutsugamushi]|nr:Uncharacterised protein [Orientia tsutsugamushi]